MRQLIGSIVLLKQPNSRTSFDTTDEESPHWAYTEVLLLDISEDNTQAEVRHPCGLDTYPDINMVFKKPLFENINS